MNNKYKFLSFPFVILILLSLCFFIFFFGLDSYGLLDKDEPRYAGTALEILKSNDWVVPKFNFQNRFDKPILFYWLISTSYKIFGISDFASRLPSAVCAVLCILFTWYTVKTVFGRKVAFLSAIILATSVEFVLLGRRAATDMALCLFFSGSMYSIFLSYYIKDFKTKICWCILAGIFCGLSILTKGPVGVLLPLIILTGFLFVKRQFDIKHLKVYFIIFFFALVVSLPWYLMIHFATQGEFTREFFFEHNLKRFTSVVGEHPGPFWFYIPVILGGFMPWTLFFISAIISLFRHLLKKSFNKLLLFSFVWIVIIFLFFSLSTTKLATYILLIFPPLSIITSYWISVLAKRKIYIVKSVIGFLLLVLIPAFAISFNLLSKWSIEPSIKNTVVLKISLCTAFLFIGILISLFSFKKAYSFIISFTLCFIIPFIFGLNSYLVPYYNYTHKDLRDFAEIAKKNGADKIISFGMYRPSLVYYSGLPVNFSDKKNQKSMIKTLPGLKNKDCIIGHTSDINAHKELFKNMRILDKRGKYFIGQF